MDESGGAIAMLAVLIQMSIFVLLVSSFWMTFSKAGKPGWASLIPIYNIVVLLQIVGRPIWWLVLMLIPLVNLVVAILVCIDWAKSFGKGVGFGIGLAFLAPVFVPILAFGSATYVGPVTAEAVGD